MSGKSRNDMMMVVVVEESPATGGGAGGWQEPANKTQVRENECENIKNF